MIVLEDDVVVVGQLEEARRRPLVVLHQQSLHREGGGEIGRNSTTGPMTTMLSTVR